MYILKIILSSLLSIAVLFIIAKLIGHKQVAQLDFFDYLCGITVGSIAAELATELEKPTEPLIAMAVYGAVSVTLAFITHKFPRTRKYINGSPTILYNDGKLYRKNMKKSKIDLTEFLLLCREQGYFDLSDIKTAIFEQNGQLSIFPASAKRPITPTDLKIPVEPEHMCTELIMDGRILEGNLKRMGLSHKWLERELSMQGYKSAKQIFLGVCDSSMQVTLYAAE